MLLRMLVPRPGSALPHIGANRGTGTAAAVCSRAERSPWQIVNRAPRLVVDPERFPDDRESTTPSRVSSVSTSSSGIAVGSRHRVVGPN